MNESNLAGLLKSSNKVYLSSLQIIVYVLLLLSVAVGIWRWGMADKGARVFTTVLSVTLIVELTAVLWAYRYHNNLSVYRNFTPVELAGYCLYLNYCIPQLRRRAIGWIASVAGFFLAVAFDYTFPKDVLGRRMVLIESVLIICGCLYACYTMLLRENDELPTQYTHFWLVTSLLFFFCFSFFSLALYNVEDPSWVSVNLLLGKLISIGNIGMLAGVLYAFIRLPKLLHAS